MSVLYLLLALWLLSMVALYGNSVVWLYTRLRAKYPSVRLRHVLRVALPKTWEMWQDYLAAPLILWGLWRRYYRGRT